MGDAPKTERFDALRANVATMNPTQRLAFFKMARFILSMPPAVRAIYMRERAKRKAENGSTVHD